MALGVQGLIPTSPAWQAPVQHAFQHARHFDAMVLSVQKSCPMYVAAPRSSTIRDMQTAEGSLLS